MNLSGLKFRLADRSFHRKGVGKINSSNGGEIKRILIILDTRDAVLLEKFSEFGKKFRLKEKDLILVTCTEPEETEVREPNFSDADLSWTGKIRKPEIRECLRDHFDILIAYSDSSKPTLEFLVRNASSGLKVGRAEISEGLYDLEIFTRYTEVDIFINEVKKYLEILKYKC